MNFLRTTISLALLACAVSVSSLAAKPATPDLEIAPKKGDKIDIAFDDKHVYVDSGDFHVVGINSGDSRFYHRDSQTGEALVATKQETDGFKLRDPAAKLLWKVKIDKDKVKIADNEEMQHAWTIKLHDDHDKVSDPKNVEVGSVRTSKGSGKVKVKDALDSDVYVVEIGKRTAGLGVLLMKDIPEHYRDIIAAELFVHGH